MARRSMVRFNASPRWMLLVCALGWGSGCGLLFNSPRSRPTVSDLAATEVDAETQNLITLPYSGPASEPATSCAISGAANVTVTTPCSCSNGVCTVGVTGTPGYTGAASFEYTVSAGSVASAPATVSFSISNLIHTPIASMPLGHASVGSFPTPGGADNGDGTNYNPCTDLSASCSSAIWHNGNSLRKYASPDWWGLGAGNRGAWYYDNGGQKIVFAKGAGNTSHTDMGYFPPAAGLLHPFYRIKKVSLEMVVTTGAANLHQCCGLAWGMGQTNTTHVHPAAPGMPLDLRAGGRDPASAAKCAGQGTANDCRTTGMDYWRTLFQPVGDEAGATNVPHLKIDLAHNFFSDTVSAAFQDAQNYAHWSKADFLNATFNLGGTSNTTFGTIAGETATVRFEVTHSPNERTLTFTVTPLATSPGAHLASGWVPQTATWRYDNPIGTMEAGQLRNGLSIAGIPGVATWEDFQRQDVMLGFFQVGWTNRCEISNLTVELDRNVAATARDVTPASMTMNTPSVIALDYYDHDGDLATSCSVSNLTNVSVSAPCVCSAGVCTVEVTGTAAYTGPASFDYTVTSNNEVSNTATSSLTIL